MTASVSVRLTSDSFDGNVPHRNSETPLDHRETGATIRQGGKEGRPIWFHPHKVPQVCRVRGSPAVINNNSVVEPIKLLWTCDLAIDTLTKMRMTLLFKVEDVFEISGRGCVIAPVIPADPDFKIRPKDQIQLRTPAGRVLDTQIASIELLKPQDGSPCRMAIMLPRDLVKQDVPAGTEVWLL